MIISVIITNHTKTTVETADVHTAEMVVSSWSRYPSVLKRAGDRLSRFQFSRTLRVIAGKTYGPSGIQKGDAFLTVQR